MPNDANAFDVFVEKIVVHNKLVSAERLKQAKSYIVQNPEISLLNFLVQTELLKQAHAEQITSKFESIQKKQQPDVLVRTWHPQLISTPPVEGDIGTTNPKLIKRRCLGHLLLIL